MKRLALGVFVVVPLTFATASIALAGAVVLDTTFGGDGLVETAVSAGPDQARDVVIGPDGEIVAAGFTGSSGGAIILAQYEADGTLDPAFGVGGIATASVPGVFVYANALARQPEDGALVVAGSSQSLPHGQDFVLARFFADGTLDAAFGVGGIAIVNLGLGFFETARAVVLQPDGMILLAGDTGSTGVVARFTPTGQLDTSFGSGGVALVGPGVGPGGIEDLALDQTGRILTAGWHNFGFPNAADFVVSRLTSSGQLDATFGGTGSVVTDFPSQDSNFNSDVPREVLVGADGSVVVVGWSMPQGFSPLSTDFIAARYVTDGTLDQSFGVGGKVRTHIGGTDQAEAAVLDIDGSIVVAGWTRAFGFPTQDQEIALVRYTVDGNLDSTFDDDGIATAGSAPDFDDVAEAAALDADGRLVVVGWNDHLFGLRATQADFLVARFVQTAPNNTPIGTHDAFEGEAGPFFCAAAGWAVDPDDPYADLNIRILADDIEVAAGVANLFRQDLLDSGVSPDGISAFRISLWNLVSFNEPHLITAQAQDAQTAEWVNLNLTPKELTCIASTSESPNPKLAFFTADCTFGGPVLVESVFFADDNPYGGSGGGFHVIGENTTFIFYTPGTDMNADGVCLFGWTGGWEPKAPWNGTFQANVFVTPKN